jgi:peptidoglycan/xylan/chitin deacetylase (PgdA/CDA1 family)
MRVVSLLVSILFSVGLTGLGIIPNVHPATGTMHHNITVTIVSPLFSLLTPTPTPTPAPTPSPTPSPTPKPLTFADMNALYGPCVYVPTLFWHHVQNEKIAKRLGHAQLTVDTEIFRSQMQYLKARGYTTIRPEQLIAFFDAGLPLPPKPMLLTFDDGYDDFASDAAPIIREFGFQATAFIPTGLINNNGFMSWDTITGLGGGNFYFANHTWSHKTMGAGRDVDDKEITTADGQLANHGLNAAKVFAYPYGPSSATAISILQERGYKLAFTTNPGSIQCKQQRLVLPRIRIGNSSLSSYGL